MTNHQITVAALPSGPLQSWVATDQIKVTEDIVESLESAPAALIGLLNGDNRGKRMMRVGADPA